MFFKLALCASLACLLALVQSRAFEDPIIFNSRQLLENDVNTDVVDGLSYIQEDLPIMFESVVGKNELRLINNTESFPFRTFGRFENLGCTGFLIQPKVVLTAGHCVYDRRTKAFFEKLDFTPAMNGASEQPYGVMEWATGRVTAEFANSGDDGSDYGIVVLKESFVDICNARGGTECEKFLTFADQCSDRTVVLNIAGYRSDVAIVEDEKMWISPCRDITIACADGTFEHVCDTTAGMAGAPLWLYRTKLDEAGQPLIGQFVNVIRGVHIGENSNNKTNQAVVVNDELIARVDKWIQEADL